MSWKYPHYRHNGPPCARHIMQSQSAGLCVCSRRHHGAEIPNHLWRGWRGHQEGRMCLLHPAPRQGLCTGSLISTKKQFLNSLSWETPPLSSPWLVHSPAFPHLIPVWPQHGRLPLPSSQSMPHDVGAVGSKPSGSREVMSPASWACFLIHAVKGACLHALTVAVGNEMAQHHQQTWTQEKGEISEASQQCCLPDSLLNMSAFNISLPRTGKRHEYTSIYLGTYISSGRHLDA